MESFESDEDFMRHCLGLGQQALALGNPPVGAIVVMEGKIIGEGIEAGKTQGDITYHAEIEAIRDALKKTGKKYLSGSVMYTTHEPCIMCAYTIRHYRIHKVVFGASVPAIGGFTSEFPILSTDKIDIWQSPPQVLGGICEEACLALTRQYQSPKA